MFIEFLESERAASVVLIICTVVSLALANSPFGPRYLALWHTVVGGLSLELWVNDALMAIFFLLIGLELEREIYEGELSQLRTALLPVLAAAGGVCVPALVHFALNAGTPTQPGAGIPMATDIAFALGVLGLAGERVPVSLRIFLAALAVIDDLAAIVVIALFYTDEFSLLHLLGALAVFGGLVVLNRLRLMLLWIYLAGGVLMWFLMLKSGVHATISGVLLAFAIPFSAVPEDEKSPSYRLEHFLHKPVAFVILPLFVLVNTGVVIGAGWHEMLSSANSVGIAAGLVIGKPVGILLFAFAAVAVGWCRLPGDLGWVHIAGGGLLGGIGFTMSIFITNLAFEDALIIDASKMAILSASMTAGCIGFLWLRFALRERHES
jgi:NhaA family Na+:H+ antiporter